MPDQTTTPVPADSATPEALRTIRAAYKAGRDVVLGCPGQAEIIGIFDRLDWRVREADRENTRLLTLLARTGEDRDRKAAHIQAVVDLHKPMRIYGECGHTHQPGDPGTLEVDDVGLVCEDGYEYTICLECCADGSAQTEDCATNHPHLDEGPCYPCPTRRALEGDQ